jgi:tetratricopeptide (TPR) repeat protein
LERALAQEILGELALKQARFVDCKSYYNTALRELGVRVPKSNMGMFAAGGWQTLRHIAQSLLFRSHGTREAPIEEQTRLRLFARAFYPGGFTNTPYFLYSVLSGMNCGERWKPTRELAMQYSFYGCILAIFGMTTRSILYVDRALKIQQQLKDEFGLAHALGWSAISYFAGGFYSKAAEDAKKAILKFEKVGDPWELNMIQLHQACSLFMLGRLDEAIVTADEAFRRSAYYQDTRTNCTLYSIVRSSTGRGDIAAYMPRVKLVDEDILSTCNLHKALGLFLQNDGKLDEAIEKFELAWTRPLKNFLPQFHVIPALPMLVSALRARAARDGNGRDLARAHRLAQRGVWLCRFFPTEYAFSLREYGEVLAQQDKLKRAAKYLEKSCSFAARQDARFEFAQSALTLARVKVRMNGRGAQEELAKAEAEMQYFSGLIEKGLRQLKAIA